MVPGLGPVQDPLDRVDPGTAVEPAVLTETDQDSVDLVLRAEDLLVEDLFEGVLLEKLLAFPLQDVLVGHLDQLETELKQQLDLGLGLLDGL